MADEQGAWLEPADGKRLPIQGNLSIGRSPKNLLVLDSPKISRRHAIINVQNVGEFWLIDLGSSNEIGAKTRTPPKMSPPRSVH